MIKKVKINDNITASLCCATVIGPEKKENQDAVIIGIEKSSGAIYIAVADGLGSCKHSAVGARNAVNIVEDWVINDLKKYSKLSESVADIVSKKMIERWKNSIPAGEDIRLYDTTLHYAIYYKDRVLLGGVGDGMLLSQLDDQAVKEHISESDYFSNITKSLASNNVFECYEDTIIDCSSIKEKIVLVLATDGIAEDIIPEKKRELISYFVETNERSGIEVLNKEITEWIVNWETIGHCDDKTIGVVIIDKEKH